MQIPGVRPGRNTTWYAFRVIIRQLDASESQMPGSNARCHLLATSELCVVRGCLTFTALEQARAGRIPMA